MAKSSESVPQTNAHDASRHDSVRGKAPRHPRIEHLLGNFAMQQVVQASLRFGRSDDPLKEEASGVPLAATQSPELTRGSSSDSARLPSHAAANQQESVARKEQ